MNPRQRRGAVFLAVAMVGAIAVFFSIVGFVNNVESQVGERVETWVVARDVRAYTPLGAADLRRIEMPARWMPETAIRSLDEVRGTVPASPLTAGTLLQRSNLVPAPSLRTGQRELAIMVDAETGVAGKVKPGDRVDVWATFPATGNTKAAHTSLIAQRLLVIDVGFEGERERRSVTGERNTNAVPVTFALGEADIKALTYAESFAEEVRLALRPPADETLVPRNRRSYTETPALPGAKGTTP